MDKRISASLVAVCLLAVCFFWFSERNAKCAKAVEINHAQCVEEAEILVAQFLKTNQVGAFTNKGTFVRLGGGGYRPPAPWNLQGNFYLNLDWTAYFTEGTQQVQIVVQKGESRQVFLPHLEAPVIYVAHPSLREN